MTTETVRGIIAIAVVLAYLLIMVVLAVVPPLFDISKPEVIREHMSFVGSLLTGIVGVILGYYFGKSGGKGD